MKLAVMQPYLFPYIGYFQLYYAVDTFVIYDDVNYITGGWINRNYILINCAAHRVTVPIEKASQGKTIAETKIAASPPWKRHLLTTLQRAYARAPYFKSTFALVEGVLSENYTGIGDLASASIRAIAQHLALDTVVIPSSKIYCNGWRRGSSRILDICQKESASTYCNLPGGEKLYDRNAFARAGVDIEFIQPIERYYRQFRCRFVPKLSILDVLMFNRSETVREYVASYATA